MRFVLPLLAAALPALAWGPEGHRLVSRLALAQLTPAAQAKIAEILGADRTLVSIATWADDVRRSRPQTGNWHFVDIPISARHYDSRRDCAKSDCVIAGIETFRERIRSAATPSDERREALMFLVHQLEDLHEPLHCSDNDDRGGNSVRVRFYDRQTNLHSVWDSGLLNHMPQEDRLFDELARAAARNAKKWSKGTITDWAEEGHRSAQKVVYGRLPKSHGNAPVTLGAEYEKRADPLVKTQLAKAGVRLAAVLNSTLE